VKRNLLDLSNAFHTFSARNYSGFCLLNNQVLTQIAARFCFCFCNEWGNWEIAALKFFESIMKTPKKFLIVRLHNMLQSLCFPRKYQLVAALAHYNESYAVLSRFNVDVQRCHTLPRQ